MSDDLRTIRRLCLRAADDAQARRAALLVEEALRCASLHDAAGAPGRLLLVRRLDLGAIAPRQASPQSVALHCERRLAALATGARRHGAAPDAGSAPVVWFRDALEAHVALGLRLAAGAPVTAWFWPLAVRGHDAALGAAAGLRRVLASLAALPEATAAVPAFVRALDDAGRLDALAAALDGHVSPNSGASAGSAPGRAAPTDVADAALTAGSPAVRAFLADALRRVASAGTPSDAPVALARAAGPAPTFPAALRPPAVAIDGPAAAGPRQSAATPLADGAEAPLRPVGLPSPAPEGVPATTGGRDAGGPRPARAPLAAIERPSALPAVPGKARATAYEAAARSGAAPPASVGGTPPAPGAAPSAATAPPDSGAAASPSHRATAPAAVATSDNAPSAAAAPQRSAAPAPADDPPPTRAGGLLLLVPVLTSLGYGEWWDEFLPGDRGRVARRLFALLLARLGVPPDDAAWQLADAGMPEDALTRPQLPAQRRADASRRTAAAGEPADDAGMPSAAPLAPSADAAGLALDRRRAALGMRRPSAAAAPGDAPADAHAAAWLALCRRRLRLDAGLGPATLVVRRAQLALTPTHADVCFGLRDIDLRVRRAGLDIDPGWVPWLGRVIAFRYEARFDGARATPARDGAPGQPAAGEVA